MRSKLQILLAIIPTVFILDQWTKRLIIQHIDYASFIPVIPGLFDIVHVRNRGAAFGFMGDLPKNIRLPFFYITSLTALLMITIYFFKLKDDRKSVFMCLALILGGAAGNIWDRISLGEVVDFLSFHWYDAVFQTHILGYDIRIPLEWPAFNVADSAISVAVVSLLFLMNASQPNQKQGDET